MASISKRTLNWIKEILPNTEDEETQKALGLIYNAGYRAGLKARGATQVPESEINAPAAF
jgi:hypothetical protein